MQYVYTKEKYRIFTRKKRKEVFYAKQSKNKKNA